MPSSSSTSSDGKSSTRKTTSPVSFLNPAGRAAKAASAIAARSSSDGALPNGGGSLTGALLIRHDDVRCVRRADLEEADVQRLLRLHGPQGLAGHGADRLGIHRLAR